MNWNRSKFTLWISLFLTLSIAVLNPAIAGGISISVPIGMEVRITTHPDYYPAQPGLQLTSPLVSDLDGNSVLEVVCAGYNPGTHRSYIYIWHRNGLIKPGWPIEVTGEVSDVPAVGDLDSDGDLEVVVSVRKNPPETGGYIYIWHHDATLFSSYPEEVGFYPGAPSVGDTKGDFGEESIVYDRNQGVAICDVDLDGKKEIIRADNNKIVIAKGDLTILDGWPKNLVDTISVGIPVAGNLDNDGVTEIFLAAVRDDGNFIYGWRSDGTELPGWPVNCAGVVNTPGGFISVGDIDNDGTAEILSGSTNGWIAAWRLDGAVVFSNRPATEAIYQPIVGDMDNDSDMEILATSRSGNIYCYDHLGNPVAGWPYTISSELSPGAIFVDIDSDTLGDSVNPINDLELLFSANDGKVYSIDLPGDFHPDNIQWGMYGFNPRNTGNYLRDWDTAGWSVFDDKPRGATISSVYDWNRGGRVMEFRGAGLNNCYMLKRPDGKLFNSKNTTLQWSMKYNLPFYIYVSVDTKKGRRFLYYTATEGSELADPTSRYIHHGLGGNAKDGKWHTFTRSLVRDLQDADPTNDIIDVNAIYVQGSGRVDDVMLVKGLPCVDLVNLALGAEVSVSSGETTAGYLNDGDKTTRWVSDIEDNSWMRYTWREPQTVNKVVLVNVNGATGGTIFVTTADGTIYEIRFDLPADANPAEIVFDRIENVRSITVSFNNRGTSVSVGEIEVYYDPNVEDDPGLFRREYTIDNYIQIRHGYFYDPTSSSYWLPHGIAYQTWVRDLGQWQSPAEIRNDLDMMGRIGVNALRVDFVWKHIETADGLYDWSRYDMLLEEAQARKMRVFPIIGYQWPPDWFPDEWYTMHPRNERHPAGPWKSDILSYEDTEVQDQFRDFLQAVVSRYSVGGVREDLSNTVAGWILGNEYGYLGLWSVEYDGYDPDCQMAFREWLEHRYSGDIGALNARWAKDNIAVPGYLPGHPYATFNEVDMPISFGYEGPMRGQYLARDKASWYDLTEWREESIARYIALAARAVRDVDSAHLISYAAVGMQWGEEDWRYHTEDARKILQACIDEGAPLNFWSINNYPWGLENDELMSGKWGIERAKHDTGLPVMITETGFTSTETIYPGINEERQARLVRNAIWEVLESGAIGVCVFHWNDRNQPGLTEREKGFGIVNLDKDPKPAYNAVRDLFHKMDDINITELLPQFIDPPKDIAFLWDDATDSIVNRYQAEMHQLYGALKRLGFNPTFINREEMLSRDFLSYSAIVLPRNQKMFRDIFNLLEDAVLSGVKIHIDADLPGIMDEYGNPRNTDADWLLMMQALFGIDTSLSNLDIDPNLEDFDFSHGYYETSSFTINYRTRRLFSPILGYDSVINMWKCRDRIISGSGNILARFDGGTGNPALILNDRTGLVDGYDTAISLFSLGDNRPDTWRWEDRYNWMNLIYTNVDNGFGLTPNLRISGSPLVLVDYLLTPDGSKVLLSFKNYSSDTTDTVEVSSGLLTGKVVKDLLNDMIIENPCDGTVGRTLEPDGHSLLLAYTSGTSPGGTDSGVSGSETESGTDSGRDTETSGGDAGTRDSPSPSMGSPIPGSSILMPSAEGISTGSRVSTGDTTGLTSSAASTEGTDSGSTTLGPATVIVLDGRDREKPDGRNVTEEISKANEGTAKVHSNYRGYLGSDIASTGEREELDENISQGPDIPPLEQFNQTVREYELQTPDITMTAPEKISSERMEEILHPKSEPRQPRDNSIWAKKLIKWISDFLNRISGFTKKFTLQKYLNWI